MSYVPASGDTPVDGLAALDFDNAFTRELPADPEEDNYRRQVSGACFSRVAPTPVAAPQLVAWSKEVAADLGFSVADVESAAFLDVFAGNRLLPGMDPYAMCYGGHQFGNWAGQLGDGRAINLGEVVGKQGDRLALQLKGAGPTPYSRTADGLAVLRSSLREYLCSEAMFHLGVPTTRALSLALTGEAVERDMLYDGNPREEPGAVVCRVAPSFLRFGNYEILAARGETELLQRLVRHTIVHHFPDLDAGGDTLDADVVVRWFAEVTRRTATMVAHWMRVGFVHGVMNTDNLSVLGLTIDYGPYGWLEGYDPEWTPNTTDAAGRRYRFGHQPAVAQWNLLQLANAIFPLVGEASPLEEVLRGYGETYQETARSMAAAKLGITDPTSSDDSLIEELNQILLAAETDMTLFYRALPGVIHATDATDSLDDALYDEAALSGGYVDRRAAWLVRWRERLAAEGRPATDVVADMNAVNPRYVLRNYLSQLAIDKAEEGDFSGVAELQETLRRPYEDQPGREHLAAKRPEWARHRAGCSMLSCSS